VGGCLGIVSLGIFGTLTVNAAGANGLLYGGADFFAKEVAAAAGASAYAFAISYAMLWIINKFTPVRVTKEEEEAGLDEALHGEAAYEA
jgi:Amt family ammonium transporter